MGGRICSSLPSSTEVPPTQQETMSLTEKKQETRNLENGVLNLGSD